MKGDVEPIQGQLHVLGAMYMNQFKKAAQNNTLVLSGELEKRQVQAVGDDVATKPTLRDNRDTFKFTIAKKRLTGLGSNGLI